MKNDDLERAHLALAIIEKEYHKSHTVTDLALMVGTNRNTLNLACKKITGMPVKKYIKFFRVSIAKQLLASTDLSIDIIAGRVGWHRSNLDSQFKKETDRSPKEWRKNPD